MKRITILLLFAVAFGTSQDTTAIDTTWQKHATGSLSFSQAHFDNWTTGGENTLAHQFGLSGKLKYNGDKYTWINTCKIAFGNSKIGEAEAIKTIDELRIESTIKYLWDFIADPYLSFKSETQLATGYTYNENSKVQISRFLDPGYFTQSAGLQYSPIEELSVRFGAAVKETITKDFPTPYADDPDTEKIETTKIEPGIESVLTFSKKIGENAAINSTLDLFNNFVSFDATDVRWDTEVITKITKYINVKLNIQLFYDKDISIKRQLNQSLLLGISYTLQ